MSDRPRPRVNSAEHERRYPTRLVVIRGTTPHAAPWHVWRGSLFISVHRTQAEAITAAQRYARERAGEPPC